MPEIIYTVVRLLQVFLAVGLVAIIVLMQRSEGGLGGLGGGGGGSGGMGGFLTGRAQSNVITRTTAILAAGFLASTLILAYGDHAGRGKPTTLVPAATTAPTAPTEPSAPATTAPTNTGPETPATATVSLPVLPSKHAQLLPYILMPISVGRAATVAAVEAALASEDKALIVVAQRDAAVEVPEPKDLYSIGCRAIIKRMARGEDGLELIVQGIDHKGFAIIDAYSPCPTFNKVNTFKYYRDQAVELPKDHNASDVMQAWARAQSTDPVYLGVLYRAEGESSFEEHIQAAQSGTEVDAPQVVNSILDRYS